MSADNGIYILVTPVKGVDDMWEYRVSEMQAVDDMWWDDNLGRESYDPLNFIKNARGEYAWGNCKVFQSEDEAFKEALRLEKECYVLEYGISTIEMPIPFNEA